MTSRIVLTTLGSSGDIHPYIGLALGLAARGHAPVIATSEYYRRKIESAGIAFRPVRPDLDPTDGSLVSKIMDPLRGSEFIIRELAMANLRQTHADLHAATEGADLLITHPLTFAGRIVAEERRMPWVSSVLAPMSFFSAHDLPVFAAAPSTHAARHLGLGATRSLIRMAKLAARHWADPVRALRAELGLPPTEDPIFEGQHSPHLVLAMFSRVLADPQPDWPPRTCITGSILYDRAADDASLPPELSRFLASGPAPIVFTLGTSAVGAAGRFYDESAAAARELGLRAVLLIGSDARNRPSGPPSPERLVCAYAPYSTLFPRAAAIVHQGGVGTTAQALHAGKPTVIVPYAHDQPDNAYRVERLGASRTVYPRHYKAPRIVETLRSLLADPAAAQSAIAVAARVRAEDGVGVACVEIERVLGAAGQLP
jgi:UDP:flavonoid glycosyltransferase YjiC (YdhE family)